MPNRLIVRDFKASATNGSAISAAGTIDTVTSNGGSMLAWMKVSSFLGDTFAGFYDSTGVFEAWRFNIESGTGYPFLWTVNTAGSGTVNPKLTTPVPKNQWFRVAIVQSISGGVVTGAIYINGVLLGTATRNSDVRSNSRFSISNSSIYKRAGVAVYERALTAQEITDDYFSGKIPTGAKINWSCQEGAGDTHYDSSGNGNNGTGGTLTWTSDVPMKKRKLLNGNLVNNGDFEYAPPYTADTINFNWIDGTSSGSSTNNNFGWLVAPNGAGFSAAFDSTQKNSGSYSLRLSCANNSTARGFVANTRSLPADKNLLIPVLPNTVYSVSLWIKTSNAIGVGIQLNRYDSIVNAIGSNFVLFNVNGTTAWTKYVGNFNTGANV